MVTIRICEESEARMMIREGCFKEYVNMWSSQFPQRQLFPQINELHSKYGLGFFDARMMARAMGAEEDVILEVGEDMLIKKKNNRHFVYHKLGDIWVRTGEGTDIFDSEDILSGGSCLMLTPICDEDIILHAKSIKALAKSIKRSLSCWHCTLGMLYLFGRHEIWKISDNDRISIFSSSLKDQSIFNSEEEIAKHVESYRMEHKPLFGAF